MTKPTPESARAFFGERAPNSHYGFDTFDLVSAYAKQCVDAALAEKWIKCEDRLPERDMRCIVRFTDGGPTEALHFCYHYQNWDDFEGDDYYCDLDKVSHWMPFPDFTEQV